MNNMRRDIEEKEVLVVKAEEMEEEYQALEERLFVATGGFGMRHTNIGGKIFGFWLKEGSDITDTIRGDWISRLETEAYQAEHGKLWKGGEDGSEK